MSEWQMGENRGNKTKGPAAEYAMHDPRRVGMKAAVLRRLQLHLQHDAKAGERGECTEWRKYRARAELLRELIAEVERMQEP